MMFPYSPDRTVNDRKGRQQDGCRLGLRSQKHRCAEGIIGYAQNCKCAGFDHSNRMQKCRNGHRGNRNLRKPGMKRKYGCFYAKSEEGAQISRLNQPMVPFVKRLHMAAHDKGIGPL